VSASLTGPEVDSQSAHIRYTTNTVGGGLELKFDFFDGIGSCVGTVSLQPSRGSSRQVDFQNIGFAAVVSPPIPEPGAAGLLASGLAGLLWRARRRRVA
jgi:hypothetical protein